MKNTSGSLNGIWSYYLKEGVRDVVWSESLLKEAPIKREEPIGRASRWAEKLLALMLRAVCTWRGMFW